MTSLQSSFFLSLILFPPISLQEHTLVSSLYSNKPQSLYTRKFNSLQTVPDMGPERCEGILELYLQPGAGKENPGSWFEYEQTLAQGSNVVAQTFTGSEVNVILENKLVICQMYQSVRHLGERVMKKKILVGGSN